MLENPPPPESASPPLSLEEMRREFAARAEAKEEERKRWSRTGSRVLISVLLVVLIVFLLVPDRPKRVQSEPDADLAAKSAELQQQLSAVDAAAGGNPGAGSAGAGSHQGDIQFALDLLRFVQPEAPQGNPPQPAPVPESQGK